MTGGSDSIPAVAPRRKRRRRRRVVATLVIAALLIAAFWYRQNRPQKWDENTWSDIPVEYRGGRTLKADPATLPGILAQAQPGDTILLADGRYSSISQPRLGGADGRPLTIRAAGRGAVFGLIRLLHSKYLIIDGISCVEQDGGAISCDHVVLRNLKIVGDRMGVYMSDCENTVLETSDIRATGTGNAPVSLIGDCSRCVIRGNWIHDSPEGAISMEGWYYPTGRISLALVEMNRITGNATTSAMPAVRCVNVVDSVFRNNLICGNRAQGVLFSRNDESTWFPGNASFETWRYYLTHLRFSRSCARNAFVGNTLCCINEFTQPAFWLTGGCRNFRVHNNIFAGGPGGTVQVSQDSFRGLDMDNNVICNVREEKPFGFGYIGDRFDERSADEWRAKGFDRHSVISPELPFVSTESSDYRLRPGSAPVDAGTDLSRACPTDIDGVKRPQGKGFDCGAYEFAPPAAR